MAKIIMLETLHFPGLQMRDADRVSYGRDPVCLVIGGDLGDLHAAHAEPYTDGDETGVAVVGAELHTSDTGMSKDDAEYHACKTVTDCYAGIGEEAFCPTRLR